MLNWMISNLVVDNLSIAFPSDENEREMEGGWNP